MDRNTGSSHLNSIVMFCFGLYHALTYPILACRAYLFFVCSFIVIFLFPFWACVCMFTFAQMYDQSGLNKINVCCTVKV